jgi:hypothetical protein
MLQLSPCGQSSSQSELLSICSLKRLNTRSAACLTHREHLGVPPSHAMLASIVIVVVLQIRARPHLGCCLAAATAAASAIFMQLCTNSATLNITAAHARQLYPVLACGGSYACLCSYCFALLRLTVLLLLIGAHFVFPGGLDCSICGTNFVLIHAFDFFFALSQCPQPLDDPMLM